MKKLLALLLAGIMAFSMVACGGTESTEDKTETPNSDVTVSQDDEKDSGKFDTSWASNEFEALLPQLPFSGWTTKTDGNTYKMELSGLKTETKTDAEGNTIGYGDDKTAIINYVESLTNYGFTVEETGGIEGYVYEWEIKDAAGNTIEVTCAEGYCWIEIVKK
ncbi:MAG: hypothetical protein IKY30_06455 [Oscillospiraceae bacterium]|nr:hypothetical protein [Oscillospiraceae bacterium]